MSLYGEYIKERLGHDIIEHQDGFVTFNISEDVCIIEEIYVRPEARGKRLGTDLANLVFKKAKEHGCKIVVGRVFMGAKNATDALKAHLSYGMKLHSLEKDFIVIFKEV